MTYQELMEEVVDLGFDSNVESYVALATATNRALAHINRQLRPLEESIVLSQREPVFLRNEEVTVTDTYMLPAEAAAVSFVSVGEGRIRIETANGTREENLSSTVWQPRKFLCGGTATITLIGAKNLLVRNIAAFSVVDGIINAGYLPIWREGSVLHDLNAICGGRFLSLASHPYTETGWAVREYEIHNSSILILPDFLRGKVQVTIRRKPRVVAADDFTDSKRMRGFPDIRAEYEDLLALCVASYLWIDLEPEKAQYYRQRFDEQVQYERLKTHQRGRERVIDRKGWR